MKKEGNKGLIIFIILFLIFRFWLLVPIGLFIGCAYAVSRFSKDDTKVEPKKQSNKDNVVIQIKPEEVSYNNVETSSVNKFNGKKEKYKYSNEEINEKLEYYNNIEKLSKEEVLQKIEILNDMMRSMINKIDNEKLKKDVSDICSTADKILEKLRIDKKQIKEIRSFIEYYFPVTLKILIKYDEVENLKLNTGNAQEFLNTVEDKVNVISKAFYKQLENLYEKDFTDATAELDVLEDMLKTEGYTDIDDFNLRKKK